MGGGGGGGEHQHASKVLLKGAGPRGLLLQDQLCLQNADTSMLRDTEKGFLPQDTRLTVKAVFIFWMIRNQKGNKQPRPFRNNKPGQS